MNTQVCQSCGALDPSGNGFAIERLPFIGTRVYCPKCQAKLEDKFILGVMALNVLMGLIGFALLWASPDSAAGHVLVNLFLAQIVVLPSVVLHEFAHAIMGRVCGLTVLEIWIGRSKTIYCSRILGFHTSFKLIPFGGLTFLTHGFTNRLRLRYFLAVLAGPLVNALILLSVWRYVSWNDFSLEHAIQMPMLVALAQIFILVENLLPYRIQTAIGALSTDGRSLFQLVFSKSPDVLAAPLRYGLAPLGTTFTR